MLEYTKLYRQNYSGLRSIRTRLLIPMMLSNHVQAIMYVLVTSLLTARNIRIHGS